MKDPIIICLMALALICFPGGLLAEEISLDNGGVKFTTPEGFSEMPDDVVERKYPNVNRPQYLYGNDNYSVSIGVKFSNTPLEMDELEAFKEMMEKTLPRAIPNLKWIARRIMTINKKDWILLELESSAVDTDIHNTMLFTSYKGKVLGFNFNSTVEELKDNQASLTNSTFSIELNEEAP